MDLNKIANRLLIADEIKSGTDFLSPEMEELLCKQVANEMGAAYFYIAAAGWCQNKGFDGLAAYYTRQSQEELKHAHKCFEYVVNSGSDLMLHPIVAPNPNFISVIDVTRQSLEHEVEVTINWKNIGYLAGADDNPATLALAQWFMTEQMEEEDNATTLYQKAQLASDGSGLLLLDHHYGQMMTKVTVVG